MISRTTSPHRAFCLGLLIALVLGTTALPVRASGRGSDSTPAAGQYQPPAAAAAPAEKEAEADETAAYRHSATVQWLARLMHVDVETAAEIFEWINFAVILLAIGIPLAKILPKTLRKRSETLSSALETARAATADAHTRLSAVEARMAGLGTEIEAIRKQVDEVMREDEKRIQAAIVDESARIVAAAEQEMEVAAAQARSGLKRFAAGLAIDGALARLSLDSNTDHALIAEFSAASRGSQAEKAGQN